MQFQTSTPTLTTPNTHRQPWRSRYGGSKTAFNAWQDQQQPRISAIYDQLAEAYDNADKHQAVSAQSDLAVDGEPPAGHVSYGLSYESGAKHPTYTREIAGSDKQPKPLLDVNALATGESFYRLVNWVSQSVTRVDCIGGGRIRSRDI